MDMIEKERLTKLYLEKANSMQAMEKKWGCSLNTEQYWMDKYGVKRRSISNAIYLKNNPKGDPFSFSPPRSRKESELYGIGLGLFWGEGTKANKDSVRLGNTDPELIQKFMEFLIRFFGVKKGNFRFGLQVFTDIDLNEALDFWVKKLKIKRSQFYKPVVSISGSIGNYRRKSRYGVLTVMYHNKKLRDLLMSKLAVVAQLVEQLHGGTRVSPAHFAGNRKMNPE